MINYAVLDENNVCVGISQLSDKVEQDNLIEIESYNEYYFFRKFENGVWSEEKYFQSSIEPIIPLDIIGIATTQNSLELAELKEALTSIGQGVVDIMLNQMGGM